MDALSKIKDRAVRFEHKNNKYGLHYLIGVDKNDDQITEIDGYNHYCDDCIDSVFNEYTEKIKHSPDEIEFSRPDMIEEIVRVQLIEEGSAERDDFCYCDNCGKLISTVGVLHTFTQEIEHWLSDDVSVDINCLTDTECFILNNLIDNASEKYPDLISDLKQKISGTAEKKPR